MEALFEVPEVTVTKAGDGLKEAWKKWCSITKRPREFTPDKKFAAAYRDAIDNNKSHEDIMEIVVHAAHLPPRGRDAKDTRRVAMALGKPAMAKQAKALHDNNAPIHFFGIKSTTLPLTTLSDIMGSRIQDWSLSDHEYAGILSDMDEEKLKEAVTITKSVIGSPTVLPSDVIRKRYAWSGSKKYTPARVDSRRVSDRGISEEEQWSDIMLSVDAAAQRMFVKGVSHEDVMTFHNLAPEGFWQFIHDRTNEGDSLSQATEDAERHFGWKESSRYEIH